MKAFAKEFKEFIARGNVLDMAVGIIIGSAFTAIVSSLVDDIVMPLISLITGGFDFTSLAVALGEGEEAAMLRYGSFISAIINFLLITLVVFFFLKVVNKMNKKKEEEPAPTTKMCPRCKETVALEATRCPHCTSEIE